MVQFTFKLTFFNKTKSIPQIVPFCSGYRLFRISRFCIIFGNLTSILRKLVFC